MKNSAKCKLCQCIIESFHRYDYVSCKCGEISVDGGSDYFYCNAKDWSNFLRVDDQGNEIMVKVKGESIEEESDVVNDPVKPSKKQMLDTLDEMIKNIENLPSNAMSTPINHYDLLSFLFLISSIFREDCKDDN